ncbi:hypothetical protein TWF696_004731 [Orbilia brochopaga]|uniref:Uncharacterized protein n=1 Tax=Orbilia brochopaga TaxID=3140254 RepID=A0AAV9UYW2_9PEZI
MKPSEATIRKIKVKAKELIKYSTFLIDLKMASEISYHILTAATTRNIGSRPELLDSYIKLMEDNILSFLQAQGYKELYRDLLHVHFAFINEASRPYGTHLSEEGGARMERRYLSFIYCLSSIVKSTRRDYGVGPKDDHCHLVDLIPPHERNLMTSDAKVTEARVDTSGKTSGTDYDGTDEEETKGATASDDERDAPMSMD